MISNRKVVLENGDILRVRAPQDEIEQVLIDISDVFNNQSKSYVILSDEKDENDEFIYDFAIEKRPKPMTDYEEFVLNHIEHLIQNDLSDYCWWDSEDISSEEFDEVQEIIKRIKLTLEDK